MFLNFKKKNTKTNQQQKPSWRCLERFFVGQRCFSIFSIRIVNMARPFWKSHTKLAPAIVINGVLTPINGLNWRYNPMSAAIFLLITGDGGLVCNWNWLTGPGELITMTLHLTQQYTHCFNIRGEGHVYFVGVYRPIIRIPYQGWIDHPQYTLLKIYGWNQKSTPKWKG